MRPELATISLAVGFAVVTMLVYRLTPAGRISADRTGRGGSFVLGFWIRNWFYWFIRPITALSISMALSPFVFNALAVLFGVAAMVAYALGHLPTAGWMVLLSGFADVIDGEVARGRNVADARGAFLDSTLDRFSEFFAFIGMAYFYRGEIGALLVVAALGGSLLVSYTRARGESVGVLCKLGIMQRAERMLLVGIGSIVDPWLSATFGWPEGRILEWIVGVIAVGTIATSVYRTVWISNALRDRSGK